jgi:flagellin
MKVVTGVYPGACNKPVKERQNPMSAINTNVTSLIAQNALRQNNTSLNTSLTRLSTGLKINTGADNPAGLIAANDLKEQQAGINQSIDNANRANNVIGTAAGGLTEVSSLLTQLQSLVSQTANSGGLSSSEVSANQQQVDSVLQTINRIAGSTQFEGKQLLNGNYSYTTSGTGTSAFASLQVNAATLADNKTTGVVVAVTNSATVGQVVNTQTTSSLGASISLEVGGANGQTQLSFKAGTNLSAVAYSINQVTGVTGVSAVASGKTLKFDSNSYGSSQYVSVASTTATAFTTTGGVSGKASGTDAAVTVNGAAAEADGKNITYRDNNLDVQFTLSSALNGGKTKTFGITGGGADFALGDQVDEADKASIGIQSVSTGSLGDVTNGFLSSLGSGKANSLTSGNLNQAQSILTEAINQVSTLSGRLGAFQKYTLGSTIDNLNVAYENASSALSDIEDTNFASETANLTRAQILSSSATTVLSQANSSPQSVLKLLG